MPKKKRLKILLDIDGTSIIYNQKTKTWDEHPLLQRLIKNHDVFLYSGNEHIYDYYEKWKTKGFIPKGGVDIQEADVLIDDNCDQERMSVKVRKCYSSIIKFIQYNS